MGEEEKDDGKCALYVQRAQSKLERQTELRERFASSGSGGGGGGRTQGVNLYVKNLEESTDDSALRALFECFGNITSAAAMKDDRGRCKGFGFVCFASPDEATKAVTEMHLKVVKGKPLYVGLAEKRDVRQERLRERYSPSTAGMTGGKGFKAGKGGASGGMPPQMYPQDYQGGMPPMYFAGMPGPQNMMHPQAAMFARSPMMGGAYPPQAGKASMPMLGMGGMGGMPMGPPGKGGCMGMMRPQMQVQGGGGRPQGPMPQQPQAHPQPQAQQQAPNPNQPLTAAALAAAPPAVQKQMIGEKLYPAIARIQPELSGKITGMMLEMDNSELLMLLESETQLRAKVDEALKVLEVAKS